MDKNKNENCFVRTFYNYYDFSDKNNRSNEVLE